MHNSRKKNWQEMIATAKKRDAKFSRKKERIDHDLIAYGASRDNP